MNFYHGVKVGALKHYSLKMAMGGNTVIKFQECELGGGHTGDHKKGNPKLESQ